MKTNSFNYSPFAFLLFIMATSFSFSAFHASSAAAPKPIHREVTPPTAPISLKEFTTLSRKEFESRTDQKLSLGQRVLFKMMQRKIRKNLKKNPDDADKLASVSLVSGLLSWTSFILGILFPGVIIFILALGLAVFATFSGFKALKKIKARQDGRSDGKGEAILGSALGLSFLVMTILVVIFVLFFLTFED